MEEETFIKSKSNIELGANLDSLSIMNYQNTFEN